MLKYLAGIFVKPRNDYVDGRLTTPLNKKMRTSCLPQVKNDSHGKVSLMSLKSVINGSRITTSGKGKSEHREPRRRREGNPFQVSRPISRSSMKSTKFQMEDPISYIVNVAASCSSNETIPPSPTEVVRHENDLESQSLGDQDHCLDLKAYKEDSRCTSKLAEQSLPVPPPITRVQSWMSCATAPLDATPFNNFDGLSNPNPKFSIDENLDPIGWEMDWLPEEF
ncbi:uncharacterized protein LOC128261133 [Drosophila gunungcola]|uniref:Uncharacterized protein n=1 Tax=Drosophila gunungcola TaxID=103775 RepID=A0A9Q0BJV2_9MUSC|nr:uncharacterized protein LOC128261133 [Drosophila gunungcola]KAI8034837.1 hypothetical protein M5D96_012353 [Drosophila gunungcola]